MARWYVRCADCLSVCAIDIGSGLGKAAYDYVKGVTCGSCDGSFEIMGRVCGSRLVVRTTVECVCDERCANATGPNCNCKCGGEHHGVGMLAYVQRDKATNLPKLTPTDPHALQRATEYRQAVERARARIAALPRYEDFLRHGRGQWVAFNRDLQDIFQAEMALHRAMQRRSHNGRMKELTAIAQ